jgi:hypothetical protein
MVNIKNKKEMKKYILSAILMVFLISGCTNDPQSFPDYTSQTVYFPLQYPIRTLVLGESTVDNSIDLQHAFNIGACVGGMYENTKDWTVTFGLAPELMNKVQGTFGGVQSAIAMLPSNYYTIETNADSTIVIPKGSFTGTVKVNLTDAFFADPNSYKFLYVLPLKLKTASTGILTGTKSLSLAESVTPNPHSSADWVTGFRPKNYTLFAVKYINQWHGTYFYRGKQYKNGVLDQTFHQTDLESNSTASVTTAGYKVNQFKRMGSFATAANVSNLIFSDAVDGVGDITVAPVAGSLLGVTGTGKYYKSNTDFAKQNGSWLVDPKTGKPTPHLTMTLDYTVTGISAGNTYRFVDTLVVRDNTMIFQEFTPVVMP